MNIQEREFLQPEDWPPPRLRAYLLGSLPEEQVERLERDFAADPALFDLLCDLERELIHAYLGGRLEGDELSRFDARYLQYPPLRRRVDAEREWWSAIGARRAARKRSSVWDRLWSDRKWRVPRMAATAGMAALSCGLVIYVAVLKVRIAELTPRPSVVQVERTGPAGAPEGRGIAEQEATAKGAAPAPAPGTEALRSGGTQAQGGASGRESSANYGTRTADSIQGVFAIMIAPGRTRDAAAAGRFRLPTSAREVELRLAVKNAERYVGYGATVENADGAVIPSSGAVTAAGGCTVRIPAAALPPDDYVVKLRGVKNGGTLEDLESYYFGVPR